MANPDKKQMITEEFDKLTPEVMAQLEKQLSGAAARIYTKQDLELAFTDGVTVGIASQDGTFGREDFMGGPAAEKAEAFIKETGRGLSGSGYSEAWERLWAYCGGFEVLDRLYEKGK